MLSIKKIFFIFCLLTTFITVFYSFTAYASERTLDNEERLIKQIDYLFKQPPESLDYDDITLLSNKIISHRIKYPNETIAKTYLLLSSVALNKGELETALQFINDGLNLSNPNQATYPCLQVTLAKVLATKKQYGQLLTITDQAILAPAINENPKFLLLALGYRSVAFAMLSMHAKALKDLQRVNLIIDENPSFNEHVSLLSIIANAYYHLGDFQTALTIQLKVLKLRFNLKQLDNVGQTYFHLGNAYLKMHRYNDAYNAFWEAKEYAQQKEAPIYIAYAVQGLALTLQHQNDFEQAATEFKKSKAIFSQHNLLSSYLETLISLAQVSYELSDESANTDYLVEAEKLSKVVFLNSDYIVLYQLLAEMYFENNNIKEAYIWQEKYSSMLLKINQEKLNSRLTETFENKNNYRTITKQLSLNLAEQSELTSTFNHKFQQQQLVILILSLILITLLCAYLIIWFNRRKRRARKTYEIHDKIRHSLVSPAKTKALYQTNFTMAKKYSFTLTLGYISISNWQELTFKFNKKIVKEVGDGISNLINEHISEVENAGLINNGEYLLFFPHQDKEQASIAMEKILHALQLRFFAHLGDFSITLAYSVDSPSFQDIDPYIFLSQLSAEAKAI